MSGHLTSIGLISGTSADGVDAVLAQTDGLSQMKTRATLFVPYPDDLREQVISLYAPGEGEVDRLGELNRELGEFFARAALELCSEAGVQPLEVHVIGSHGQTVRHRPGRFTMQVGDAFIISARTGITTLSDFRPADMALGGQGAPLVPLFHQTFLGNPGQRTAVINIGGIANITALPSTSEQQVMAGDVGPGNSLMDLLSDRNSNGKQHFDDGGTLAAQGTVHADALGWLMSHPFLDKPFPKSTGREEFGHRLLDEFLERFPNLSQEERFSTLTQFSVLAIAKAVEILLPPGPQRMVLVGGGARNPEFARRLKAIFPQADFVENSSERLDPDFLEAQAFAWMAVRTLRGLPSSLPAATGAKRPAVLGTITPGRNWASLIKKLNLGNPWSRGPRF